MMMKMMTTNDDDDGEEKKDEKETEKKKKNRRHKYIKPSIKREVYNGIACILSCNIFGTQAEQASGIAVAIADAYILCNVSF